MSPEVGCRYALCVGIGHYTALAPTHLKPELTYAVSDAKSVATILGDPLRGNFAVTLLTEPEQTTKQALEDILDVKLNAPELKPEDMVVIYFACHGMAYGARGTFCLLPSNARLEKDDTPKKSTVIDIHDLAKTLAGAKVKNIVFLLDACYSGGVGGVLQYLDLQRDFSPDSNLSIIAAAQWDQYTYESSKARHGIFTDCLLQACEQKPIRNDGWLTIKQIGSFLTENIQSYKTARQIYIPEISMSISEILMVRNPRYSPQSLEFHEQVQTLLALAQYEPIDIAQLEESQASLYIAEVKAGLGTQRYGVFSYYNEVEALTNEEAQKIMRLLEKLIEQDDLERGMLVTKREVSHEVKALLSSRMLEIRTEESIWRELIDFKKYLRGLVDMYEKPSDWSKDVSLASIYIHLNALYHPYKQGAYSSFTPEDRNTSKDYSTTRQGDLEEVVRHWLTDPDLKGLALLSGYGSGKTTFCRHMAAALAREYLTGSKNRDHIYRIPLWIPLLNFAKAPFDLDTFLVAHLKQYCKVDNPSAEALLKMAEAGLIFFMFDGFDEMASRANTNTVRQNILLFKRLAELPRNKVLLTARPEYFIDLTEEQRILGSFPRLYLQPLNNQQVELYLQKRVPSIKVQEETKDWLYYLDKIQAIHDLSNLTQRPVLLEMIVKTLPILITEGKAINRSNLYRYYLEEELERQFAKQRRDLQIDNQQRFTIMECIARELYRTDTTELTSNQIREISKEILTTEQKTELEGSLREILACSFLNRTGDTYQFSHLSFLEYLVSRCLAQDIKQGYKELFRQRSINSTIQGFLLELETGTKKESVDGTISVDISNTDVNFSYKTLEQWFCQNSGDKWVSNNALSLLIKCMPPDKIRKLPLKGRDLSGADFSKLDLSEIDFSGAGFSVKRFIEGAVVGGSYGFVVGAMLIPFLPAIVLGGAVLGGIIAGGVLNRKFETNLSGVDLSGVDLSGANLRGANLRGANLREANLSKANLSGTDIVGTDLSGANLSGTNFRWAKSKDYEPSTYDDSTYDDSADYNYYLES